MPSTIELLPKDIKAALDAQLAARHFSGLSEIVDCINALIEQKGLEIRISRSALGRYSHDKLKPMLDRIELSTKMAEAIANSCPDEQGNVNEAILRMAQDRIFQKLCDLEEELSAKDLASISQSIAQIVRASMGVKKYKNELKDKLDAKFAEISPRTGIDMETLRVIREEIYGIVS